jgi:hypothetical protein
MADIVNIPIEKRYPRIITAEEIWAQPAPSSEMIWEVCVYTKGGQIDRCKHCPESEPDEHGNIVTQGCRVWAAEACRVVMAMQARNTNPK